MKFKYFIEAIAIEVEKWVSQSQHTVKYFPQFQMLALLNEKISELELEVSGKNSQGVVEEIGDVLFSLVCLFNGNNINISSLPDKVEVLDDPNQDVCIALYRCGAKISRLISHMHGHKKRKESETETRLSDLVLEMVLLLEAIARQHGVKLLDCFGQTMVKKNDRDRNRFS